TVGAGVAVVSNTALSLPSAEVFPALSVIVALTVIVPPSAGAYNDGLISKAELDGKVDVTITVPTEANVGDTLNV
ncbi:hypothetical protein, partial [Aliarcobacter butzleri]|uniref:hypothetical protein n=1 Tax=Aliarcobacter butzleri TaxID=28197 RepID=UPI001869F726